MCSFLVARLCGIMTVVCLSPGPPHRCDSTPPTPPVASDKPVPSWSISEVATLRLFFCASLVDSYCLSAVSLPKKLTAPRPVPRPNNSHTRRLLPRRKKGGRKGTGARSDFLQPLDKVP